MTFTPDLKAAALAAKPIEAASELLECDHCIEKFHALANPATILALIERLQVAEDAAKDGADRLDWIMQQADDFSCHVLQDMPGDGNYAVFGMNNNYGEGGTFIEALDAARRLTP